MSLTSCPHAVPNSACRAKLFRAEFGVVPGNVLADMPCRNVCRAEFGVARADFARRAEFGVDV